MARVSLDPPRTLSFRIGAWFLRRQFGDVLDPYRAQSHNTRVAAAFAKLEQSAGKWDTLDARIRDLADLAAAVRIGCPWCMDFGYWVLHTRGIAHEQIEAVPHWRETDLFNPVERLVMQYAEAMTDTPPSVDDDLVRRLLAHFTEAQLVELTAVVCLENVRSRFNSALGITPQGFKQRCEFPTTAVRS